MQRLLNIQSFKKKVLALLLAGVATSVAAHTYFFGVSDLSINASTQHIEVIHQFTAHDVENAIAQIKNVSFSPEHPQYDAYIQDYFEQHFELKKENQLIPLDWVGFEVKLGKLIAYQESKHKETLGNVTVTNSLLIDIYRKQLNTVNYKYKEMQGSLTFTQSQIFSKISKTK